MQHDVLITFIIYQKEFWVVQTSTQRDIFISVEDLNTAWPLHWNKNPSDTLGEMSHWRPEGTWRRFTRWWWIGGIVTIHHQRQLLSHLCLIHSKNAGGKGIKSHLHSHSHSQSVERLVILSLCANWKSLNWSWWWWFGAYLNEWPEWPQKNYISYGSISLNTHDIASPSNSSCKTKQRHIMKQYFSISLFAPKQS